MVTTKTALEKEMDIAIKKWEKEQKAISKAKMIKTKFKTKVKAKKAVVRAKIGKKIRKDIFKERGRLKSSPLTRSISKAFSSAMKPLPRARRAPVSRRPPMRRPVAIRRAPVRRVIIKQSSRLPASVKELQHTQNLKRFLTPAEKADVESGIPGMMRFNAVQILRKRILDKEKEKVKLNRILSN